MAQQQPGRTSPMQAAPARPTADRYSLDYALRNESIRYVEATNLSPCGLFVIASAHLTLAHGAREIRLKTRDGKDVNEKLYGAMLRQPKVWVINTATGIISKADSTAPYLGRPPSWGSAGPSGPSGGSGYSLSPPEGYQLKTRRSGLS